MDDSQLTFDVVPQVRDRRPVWKVKGYIKEPRRSWTKKRQRENYVGELFVRAANADRAAIWAKSRFNPLPSWRRVKFVYVTQAHPVHDLGMQELSR